MTSAAAKRVGGSRPALWPMWAAVPTVVLVGLGVVAGACWLLWFALGQPARIRTGWDARAQLDVLRTSLILAGGVGAGMALLVGYRRQRIAEHRGRLESTRLFNERFTAASEQLGHGSAPVRLAGAVGIAALADEWTPQRQACVDVLCGYLRMPYQPARDEPGWREGEREVRLSIIRTIRDHLRRGRKDALTWQGLDFDFTHATFDGGDLSGTNFAGGMVSFEGAQFSGSVSFMGARFSAGKVSFVGAHFGAGNVYFADAQFAGGSVYFMDALFAGGVLVFMGARFSGSDVYFMGAQFSGSEVSFRGAQFTSGHLSFRGAQFSGGHVSFGGAAFTGGHVDFSHVEDWSAPVTFDTWLGGTPSGLVLPRDVTLELGPA